LLASPPKLISPVASTSSSESSESLPLSSSTPLLWGSSDPSSSSSELALLFVEIAVGLCFRAVPVFFWVDCGGSASDVSESTFQACHTLALIGPEKPVVVVISQWSTAQCAQ
jgi:hypothetical protein